MGQFAGVLDRCRWRTCVGADFAGAIGLHTDAQPARAETEQLSPGKTG
jgi:hypothetical protein